MKINICVSVNSKYVRYLYVMLNSLFISNSKENICVYVLQRDLTREDKQLLTELADRYGQQICFVDVDVSPFERLPTTQRYSAEIYFRLLIPELLPEEVTRVLYLDVDIIVCASLRELYLTDLENCLFAVCEDMDLKGTDYIQRSKLFNRCADFGKYFNSGVMLWNITEVRKHYSFQDFMRVANEHRNELYWPDQDLLNYMAYGRVKYVDPYQYNYFVKCSRYEKIPQQPVILHFTGCNPWQVGVKTAMYQVWWDYVKLTPFYAEFLEEQLDRTERAATHTKQQIEIKEIYRAFYELKGTERIAAVMNQAKCSFAIYGAGVMGEELWSFLASEGVQNMPAVVMDQGREEPFHAIEITKNFNWVNSVDRCQLIVTPSYLVDELVKQLQDQLPEHIEAISLRNFLEKMI